MNVAPMSVTRLARGSMDIESELKSPSANVRLVHYHFREPPDSMLRVEGKFRIELCLTSRHRTARACFSDLWSVRRFERIGTLFVLPPAMDLLTRSDEDESMTSVVCELNTEPTLELFEKLPSEATEQQLLASLDVQDARVRNLLLRLAEELKSPGFASEMLVEALATQMAVELFRHGKTITDSGTKSGLAPWQLRRIEERLKEIQKAPTLAELASMCRISVRQLTRGFRASRGCSIGAYVARSQMEHAKTLLAAGYAVSVIASTLGFASSSNFCFAFRRVMGTNPGQFRETLLRA